MATKGKTNRSLKKRFRVTATGKLKRQRAGKRHLNSHMTGKRKQKLDRPAYETGKRAEKYLIAMGEA
jgi:large subunit ribosomal protein L35